MVPSSSQHEPVLVSAVLRLLDPQPGDVILDGTVGLGGHAAALLPLIRPDGRYLGLDVDRQMLSAARQRLSADTDEAVQLIEASYAEFAEVLERAGVAGVDHMLLDLGVNSAQLADPARGFSFERDGPLDMRYALESGEPALELVNSLSERDLADLIYDYGQEGSSRRIAKRICQVRREGRITTTRALASAVESALADQRPGSTRLHPATRVFQALRIAVNRELDNLQSFLDQVAEWLNPNGKLAVISFHSLEDGLVKKFVRAEKAAGVMRELTPRPVTPEGGERRQNPRSRSAKLRVAQRVGESS